MQFRLTGSKASMLPIIGIIVLATTLMTGIAVLALALSGALPWLYAIGIAIFLLVVPFAILWDIRRSMEGIVEITDTHVIVKAPGRHERYRLDHIEDVSLKRVSRLWGAVNGQAYAELRLNRSKRDGIWSNSVGTDIIGIPTLVFRHANLMIEDAERFVENLREKLGEHRQ